MQSGDVSLGLGSRQLTPAACEEPLAEGSPGSQPQNAIPSQPDIIQPKKRSPSYYSAMEPRQRLSGPQWRLLPSDLRVFTSRPHPSLFSPFLLSLPLAGSLAGSLARSLAPLASVLSLSPCSLSLFLSLLSVLQLSQVQPPSESAKATTRQIQALLLISQGEN